MLELLIIGDGESQAQHSICTPGVTTHLSVQALVAGILTSQETLLYLGRPLPATLRPIREKYDLNIVNVALRAAI